MSVWEQILWLGLMLLGFAGSALFSGLETGAYSLNRVRLQIYHHQEHAAARTLRQMLDQPTELLTTLLIGNNATNYLGTASLAVILQGYNFSDWTAILLNTLIVTPMLFVFGETLPKDLFAAYSDRLMYRLAPVLQGTRRLFTWTGLVPLIGVFTRVLMAGMGQSGQMRPFHPRRQVQVLVKEGVGYGLLSDDQSAMVERVLELGDRSLRDEMVPWKQVETIRADAPPAMLWELADRSSHTRFPVLDGRGQVVGVISVMHALLHHQPETCPPIRQLMHPVTELPATTPLRRGLTELQRRRIPLVIVTDSHGHPVGLVTMKDLIEAITGELASW